MREELRKITLQCDLCVIGGGLAGSFVALAAARHGAKVILLQDRPMLGGNASSEIRMWVRGAKGKFNRETGLISELEERNIYENPTLVHSRFDAVLYNMIHENANIQIFLNTSCADAQMDGNRIISVTAWQSTTYTWINVSATLFADCSGDSILAPLTGAHYRKGREAKDEFHESLAQDVADTHTMGMSILLAARETDHPVKFIPPAFANVYPTDESFEGDVNCSVHAQIREHKIGTSGGNLWWVELGGEGDTIHDADRIREELLACIYGVWDHIKNQEDHGMENWDLEWVGFLPGKRESRRYVGDIVVTEHDILSGGHFDDEIAFGGWPLDDHNPYGMRRNSIYTTPSIMIPVKEIYGIPLRALYSENIDNLLFAGRNISVTHVALSSTRVMATCSLLGQAAGTAAAFAIKHHCSMRTICQNRIREVQCALMDDGVFLPHIPRTPETIMAKATMNIEEADREILLNGWERPRTYYFENSITQKVGERFCLNFGESEFLGTLRLRFDPDFERKSIADNSKMRVFAMKLHTGLDFKPVRIANTIVKAFAVFADGVKVYETDNNYLSLVKIPLNIHAKTLEVQWIATHGAEDIYLYSIDVLKDN